MTRDHIATGWRRATLALLLVPVAMALLIGALVGIPIADALGSVDGLGDLAALRLVVDGVVERVTDALSATMAERLRTAVLLATGATALALAVGVPAAGFLVRARFRGVHALRTLLLLPLLLPALVVALGLRRVLVEAGWVSLDAAFAAAAVVVLTQALYGVALAAWLCGDAWARLDPAAVEAARVLGARPWRAWWGVTWPALRPAVGVVAALTFGAAFVSVAAVLVAGDARLLTLEAAIASPEQALPASTLAVLSLVNVLVLAVLALLAWPRPRGQRFEARRPRGLGLALGLLATLLALAAVAAAVAGVVDGAVRTRAPGAGVLDAVARVVETDATREAALRSAGLAAAAALVATAVAASAAWMAQGAHRGWPRAARVLLVSPVILAPVAVGVALRDGLDLRAGAWLVVIAHALLAYPLALRIVASTPRRDAREVEAAETLGVSRRQALFRLRARSTLAGWVAALLAAALLALGEVVAAPRLAPDTETIAVRALREATTAGGDLSLAYGVAVLILGAAVIALLLPYRWWRGAAGGSRQ